MMHDSLNGPSMNTDLQALVALPKGNVLTRLQTREHGLTHEQAKQRRQQFAGNAIGRKSYRSIIYQAIPHSINPLTGILIATALISYFIGNALLT